MDKNFKIFVIAALVFLGVAIAGSVFVILNIVNKPGSETAAQVEKDKSKELKVVELGDAITANIFDEYKNPHIIRVVIALGVDEESKEYKGFSAKLTDKNIVIRDEIIQAMREQTYEMMAKVDAKTKLGDEIQERLNKVLDTEIIEAVYYGDFFVQ